MFRGAMGRPTEKGKRGKKEEKSGPVAIFHE